MSMPIVAHVRQKSQAKGAAFALLLDLAIYANDCCGVAYAAEDTLRSHLKLSRQRIFELLRQVERGGELVIHHRPGRANLYFLAFQGQPLGPQGDYLKMKRGQHQPSCPWRKDPLEISRGCLWKSLEGQPPKKRENNEAFSLSREERLARARRLGMTEGSPGWVAYVEAEP